MSYKHLSITEREMILFYMATGLSICQIATILGRNKSTIFREFKRNKGEYSPNIAQARYQRCGVKAPCFSYGDETPFLNIEN